MKKYKFALFVFVFTLLFTFSLKSVSAVTVSSNCTINSTLRIGSTGDEVACLQLHLGLISDGKFGTRTQIIVKAFQANAGLKADGVVGPRSIKALEVSNSVISTPVTSNSTSSTCVNGYDSSTFFKCGCTSTSGFSSISGEPCSVSPIIITSLSLLPNAKVGTKYVFTPIAVGGLKDLAWNNYVWSVSSGNLPTGLIMAEGLSILGTPTTKGTYNFSLTASNGSISATKQFTLTVDSATTSTCSIGGFDSNTGFRCGCTSATGFNSIDGLPCFPTPTPTPVPVSTCSVGGFDSNTGFRCGCTSVSGYSSVDGGPCGNASNFRSGCTSYSGFSSVDGSSCAVN
ncbi:MAG: peptidoglycan-binding domain-containing protein [Candidatus Pacebacteria bacterium]|nr:peptidoglycan-binding domain-containing protein [Candidatus Paceibacterota bacterium]